MIQLMLILIESWVNQGKRGKKKSKRTQRKERMKFERKVEKINSEDKTGKKTFPNQEQHEMIQK